MLLVMPECHAGRTAFFGGAWSAPCPSEGTQYIGSPEAEPIILCESHFKEVMAAGLVTEPNIGNADYQRREAQRTRPKGWRGLLNR